MKTQDNSNRQTDVSRSENQQAQQIAGKNGTGEESTQSGTQEKGNPRHQHGDHEEGQYTKQSTAPGMDPSGLDEE